jgi:hypothetical protein
MSIDKRKDFGPSGSKSYKESPFKPVNQRGGPVDPNEPPPPPPKPK